MAEEAGHAAPNAEFPRFYVGAGGGLTMVDTGVDSLTGSATLDEDDVGYKGFAGVWFFDFLAVEGFYADLGQAELTGNNGDTFRLDGTTYQFTANDMSLTTNATTFGASAVLALPVTEWLKPYVKGGVHRWELDANLMSSAGNADTSDKGTDAFYGLGVQVTPLEWLGIRGEWERFRFDGEDVDFFSANVLINF